MRSVGRVVSVLVALLGGCRPSRGVLSLPHADYEYEKAPDGPLKDEAKRVRDASATAWVRKQLVDVKDSLRIGDYEKAFGAVTSVHKHAVARGLVKLDAEEIQPLIKESVLGIIPKLKSEPRKVVAGLLGFLDAAHDAEARDMAARPFAATVSEHDALAAAAQAKGHTSAAFLHRAIADYFGFRRIAEPEQKRRRNEMAAIAGLSFEVTPVSSCSIFEYPVISFGNAHHEDVGHPAKIRVEVSSCSLGKVVSDEVTQERKPFKRVVSPGSTTTTKEDGHYEQKSVRDSSGNEIYKTGTGHYIEGATKTTTTEAVVEDAETIVQIHRVHRQWDVQAVIVIETGLTSTVRVPISYSEGYDDEQWDVPAEAASQLSKSFDRSLELNQEQSLKSSLESSLNSAAAAAYVELSRMFMAKAASTTDPDEQLALYVNSIFAAGADPDAGAKLEAMTHVPADDIVRALGGTNDVTMDSSLAYRLPELPKLTAEEAAQTENRYDTIEMRATAEGAGGMFEVMAGIQQSTPTRIELMAGNGAPPPGNPEASASYGLGVGARVAGGKDPARIDNGGIFGGGLDLRLGYAGGMFIDANVPLWAGYRFEGVGVTAQGMVGWNKLGKDKDADLWVPNSPYVGYGVNLSYISWGVTDFALSWNHIVRSTRWQEGDPFAARIKPTIGDESRLEFKVLRFQLGQGKYEDDIVKSLSLRYSSFTGDQKDGRAITLWYGYGAL